MNDAHTLEIWHRIRSAPNHTGTTLEAHMEGTASLLQAWGQRRCVELAGRYHAVYGNPGGRAPICSTDSPELATEIGDEAECLVRLWSWVKRESLAQAVRAYCTGEDPVMLVAATGEPIPATRQQYLDLAHLYTANAIEVCSRGSSRRVRETVQGLRPVLCSDAVATLNEYRQRPWPVRRLATLRKQVRGWIAS